MVGVGITDGSRAKNDVGVLPRSSSAGELDTILYWSEHFLMLNERSPHQYNLGCLIWPSGSEPIIIAYTSARSAINVTPQCLLARYSFEGLDDILFFKADRLKHV